MVALHVVMATKRAENGEMMGFVRENSGAGFEACDLRLET
jgi:hypothetical protein